MNKNTATQTCVNERTASMTGEKDRFHVHCLTTGVWIRRHGVHTNERNARLLYTREINDVRILAVRCAYGVDSEASRLTSCMFSPQQSARERGDPLRKASSVAGHNYDKQAPFVGVSDFKKTDFRIEISRCIMILKFFSLQSEIREGNR